MILRIDDTGVERNTRQSLQSICEGLNWLHLSWDEQYRQSERLAHEEGERSRAAGPWLCHAVMRELRAEESGRRAAAGERFVLRFRVPRETRETRFTDCVYGEQSKATADIENFALLRNGGMPTYHLASCADDASGCWEPGRD